MTHGPRPLPSTPTYLPTDLPSKQNRVQHRIHGIFRSTPITIKYLFVVVPVHAPKAIVKFDEKASKFLHHVCCSLETKSLSTKIFVPPSYLKHIIAHHSLAPPLVNIFHAGLSSAFNIITIRYRAASSSPSSGWQRQHGQRIISSASIFNQSRHHYDILFAKCTRHQQRNSARLTNGAQR